MKKSISIVLSLLMVFSCFTCLLTSGVKAEAATNYVVNGDFESSSVGSRLPALLDTQIGTQKQQWYRYTGGLSETTPAYTYDGENYTAIAEDDYTTVPYAFPLNTKIVKDPTGGENKVARVVQNAVTFIEPETLKTGNTYKVSIRVYPVDTTSTSKVELGLCQANKKAADSDKLSNVRGVLYNFASENIVAADLNGESVKGSIYIDNTSKGFIITMPTNQWNVFTMTFQLPEKAESTDLSTDLPVLYLFSNVANVTAGGTSCSTRAVYLDDVSLTECDLSLGDFSFEKYYNGCSLKVTSNAAYPKNGEWGGNMNNGYFGALGPNVILPDGTVTQKYDYEFYNKYYDVTSWNGSLPSEPQPVSWGLTADVTEEAKHSGNQSLKLAFNWWTAAMGLDVEKNTDYEFSFYWLATAVAEGKTMPKLKSAAIVSDLNVYRLADFKWVPQSDPTAVVASNAVTLTVQGVNSAGSTSEWQKVTLSFNSGNLNKVYFVLTNDADKVIYLDDLNLKNTAVSATENYSVKVVDVSGNKLNSGYGEIPTLNKTQNEGAAGTQVEVIATNTNQKLTFKGWSADGGATFVSTNESYEHALANQDLVAVYSYSENVLGDFEAYDEGACLDATSRTAIPTANGVVGANKNAGYYGTLVNGTRTDIYNNVEAVTAGGTVDSYDAKVAVVKKEENGNKYLLVGEKYPGWGRFITLAVQPNTNYKLSFKYRDSGVATMQSIFVSTTVNISNLVTSENSKYALAAKSFKDRTALVTDWTELTFNFNSGNLSAVYLVFGDNGMTAPSNTENRRATDVDDLYLASIADDSITTFGGASIRTTGNPALRFKSTIDVAAIEAATGATVSEFGFTAIRSDYLGTAALVKDGVYGSKKAVTGVAYQAGGEDNKILEQNGNKYTFRAALYNIGVNKDGKKFDYSILGKEFSVRTYVVLQHNGGTREVLYGETQSYSIFEVAKFLEENSATYESDWNAVNSYLNAADQTADINNVANRAAAYEAWKASGSGYTGDIDK